MKASFVTAFLEKMQMFYMIVDLLYEAALDVFLHPFQNGTRNLQSYFRQNPVQKPILFNFDYLNARHTR